MQHSAGFGGLPQEFTTYHNAKIVIVPVPYDGTSTWIKGADRGPAAVIEASAHMELYDIETNTEVYRRGIATDKPVKTGASPEKMVEAVHKRTAGHLSQNKFVVTLGGEHSVSIGAVKAHYSYFGGISVLQLDAHADLRNTYLESNYNHACVMARVREWCHIIQVGIRSMDVTEKLNIEKGRMFLAHEIAEDKKWIEKVIANLRDSVYITIDLDVFDPSVMPATGTPEPGGLFWHEVTRLLGEVAANKTIVGFDVVELCPNKYSRQCDFLAAKLIYKLLSYKFKGTPSEQEIRQEQG